jgi:PHD/YefM family antitoxin component YafN of YafNO toxin-antitoxin module
MNSTIELHPEFITKNGEPEFAVLPYSEFKALQEFLEDVEDIIELREARKENEGEANLNLDEVEKELGLR